MFARPTAKHHQMAYVTNDIEAAIAMFKEKFDVPSFYQFSNTGQGMKEAPNAPQVKIALAVVDGQEIELIEPIGDTAPLFSDLLPNAKGLVLRFHHACIRIEGSLQDWEAHIASINFKDHPKVWNGELGDELRFIYTDERATLGHYVEHVWMSPTLLERTGAAVPKYPAAK